MIKQKNIIAIIFARGGSKGVPKKNIKLLNDKPLIAYTIQCGLRSKYIDKIYVSTDCEDIANTAKLYNAEVPFIRPKDLAEDKSPEHEAWKHAVNYFKTNMNMDDFIFVALPCVTPLKTVNNIDNAIELFLKKISDIDVVYTCMEAYRNPYFNMVKEECTLIKICNSGHKYFRRQDAPKIYDLTPAVIVTDSVYIENSPRLLTDEGRIYPLMITKEEGVDIDDIYDFNLAEKLIKDKSLDYIICGLGSIGRRHLNNIINKFPDKKIGLLRRENIKDPEYPEIEIFTDFDSCMNRHPKAFIICTPSSHHIDIAIQAAKFNVNIFIEKPLSNTMNNVNNFIKLVKEKNINCMIGFDLRFHPAIIKLKELLDKNIIGKIYSIEAQVGQYLPDWKPNKDYSKEMSAKKSEGGGVLNDLVHEIDYVTYLIGNVTSVFGITNKYSNLNIETEDMAKIILNFKNGCVGYIHLDYLQRQYSRSCKIIGEKGTIKWDYVNDTIIIYEKEKKTNIPYEKIDRNTRYSTEISYFINCIENNIKCEPNEDVGYKTLQIIEYIKESSNLKKMIEINN